MLHDLSLNLLHLGSPMGEPMFWIALICQLIVVTGYFFFYRKEQLGKSGHAIPISDTDQPFP
jgi:hypothetical protein